MPSRAHDMRYISASATYPRPIDYACYRTVRYVNKLDLANISNDIIEFITRDHQVEYYILASNLIYSCIYSKPPISCDPKVYRLTVAIQNDILDIVCIAQFYELENIGRFSIADNGVAHISGRPCYVEVRNITLCIDDRSYISTLCNVDASIMFGDGTILDEYDTTWVKERTPRSSAGVWLHFHPLIKQNRGS